MFVLSGLRHVSIRADWGILYVGGQMGTESDAGEGYDETWIGMIVIP